MVSLRRKRRMVKQLGCNCVKSWSLWMLWYGQCSFSLNIVACHRTFTRVMGSFALTGCIDLLSTWQCIHLIRQIPKSQSTNQTFGNAPSAVSGWNAMIVWYNIWLTQCSSKMHLTQPRQNSSDRKKFKAALRWKEMCSRFRPNEGAHLAAEARVKVSSIGTGRRRCSENWH